MDQNFSDILSIFKRLDESANVNEGMTKQAMWHDAESMSRDQFCEKWGTEHGEFWDNICGDLDEDSMASAEHHKSGPDNFTGYWKGTDKATPGNHMVGASESVEECGEPMTLADKLRALWAKTKKEQGVDEAFGGNNPSQAPATGTTPGVAPVAPNAPPDMHSPDALAIKQSLQGLKNKVPSINVDKATQALTKTDADQKLATNDNAAIATGLAPALADIAKNPQLASKLKDLVNQGQKSDLAAQQSAAQQQGGAQ
jgi:hypothetical protein